jgi:hypothetical protein
MIPPIYKSSPRWKPGSSAFVTTRYSWMPAFAGMTIGLQVKACPGFRRNDAPDSIRGPE